MRLTYSVTIGEEKYSNVYAEVGSDPDDTHPIMIKYADDEGGPATVLSFEQFDVIADLVRAHRPDNQPPRYCGIKNETNDLPCLVAAGAIHTGHVDRTGFLWPVVLPAF